MRDKNPLWAWAVIFVTFAHARPDVRNFLTSGNGCFQSPSFPNHVTKKRRALGTRMVLATPRGFSPSATVSPPTKLDTSKSKVDIWKWPLSWGHLESHCQVSSLRASSPFSASETGREKTRERTAKLWGVREKRAPRFRFSFRVPLTRNFSRLSQMESLLNVLLAK